MHLAGEFLPCLHPQISGPPSSTLKQKAGLTLMAIRNMQMPSSHNNQISLLFMPDNNDCDFLILSADNNNFLI